MIKIEQFQPAPQQELAKKVMVSGAMSKVLDRLEKRIIFNEVLTGNLEDSGFNRSISI